MRWTPSIVPKGHDETVYLVLDDFGRKGRAYRETDVERTDLEAVINDLMTGQYNNPITVVASIWLNAGQTTYQKRARDGGTDTIHSTAKSGIVPARAAILQRRNPVNAAPTTLEAPAQRPPPGGFFARLRPVGW
jgi:hypothetical protein